LVDLFSAALAAQVTDIAVGFRCPAAGGAL